jgi:hypothetical protein
MAYLNDQKSSLKIGNAHEHKRSYFKHNKMDKKIISDSNLKIIGRIEKILLPDLLNNTLDAKIDTGAYTSSLHCHSVNVFSVKGRDRVRFYLLDPTHPEYEGRQFESPVYKIKKIRSSNGIVSERVIIKQRIKFGGKISSIQLSLSNRSDMKYPLLIGRRFISGKFLVDVSKKYLNS